MGLDFVEIVFDCEERFNIKFPRDAFGRVFTAADLHQLILKLLNAPAAPAGVATAPGADAPNSSRAAFYRIRQGLADCGIPGDHVLPSSRLEDLMPALQRKLIWQQLARATGLKLPDLVVPAAVARVTFAAVIGAGTMTWILSSWRGALLMTIVSGFAAALLATFLPWPKTAFAASCQTVDALVLRAVAINRHVFLASGGLSDNEVWCVLRGILCDVLNVSEDDIKPESRLVQDLNVG